MCSRVCLERKPGGTKVYQNYLNGVRKAIVSVLDPLVLVCPSPHSLNLFNTLCAVHTRNLAVVEGL